jgi:NAD(P)-dependent dehydrogenase (short-subunit alcohol dehydrogenase family)
VLDDASPRPAGSSRHMARVLVTGSTTGLGRATAAALLDDGHHVIVHARSERRAADLADLIERGADLVVGDLVVRSDVVSIADQVNALERLDAVVHNAGVYVDRVRVGTADGHANVLAVNVLAPYLLTALIERPDRLVYLSSGMHRDGDTSLRDIDWHRRRWSGVQAYCDSKLFVTALAAALARRWPTVRSNAVDPGWVPTRMGGAGAPDDLTLGHVTQAWLAVSTAPAADTTGGYWFHQQTLEPAAAVIDPDFQAALLEQLAQLTGIELAEP